MATYGFVLLKMNMLSGVSGLGAVDCSPPFSTSSSSVPSSALSEWEASTSLKLTVTSQIKRTKQIFQHFICGRVYILNMSNDLSTTTIKLAGKMSQNEKWLAEIFRIMWKCMLLIKITQYWNIKLHCNKNTLKLNVMTFLKRLLFLNLFHCVVPTQA